MDVTENELNRIKAESNIKFVVKSWKNSAKLQCVNKRTKRLIKHKVNKLAGKQTTKRAKIQTDK